MRNIVIVGAGPAGLFSAICCTTEGRNVTILEKNDSPGKKLLLTGSGQCNLTNAEAPGKMLKHYFGADRFLKPSIMAFDSQKLIGFFEDRGLKMFTRESGKVFPITLNARDVLEILLSECARQGIEIKCNSRVTSVERTSGGSFTVGTSGGFFEANLLAITTGGKSYPYTGSSGEGYSIASKMGHTINEPVPALAAVCVEGNPFEELAGISLREADVSLWRDGKRLARRFEDLLFTHTGLSGPAVLHLSREILAGDQICVNLSKWKEEEAETKLLGLLAMGGKKSVKNILLQGLSIPERIVDTIVDLSQTKERIGADIRKEERKRLLRDLTRLELKVSRTDDFLTAMMTRGGVSLGEVNPKTMESRIVQGLYFAGEVLDFDGETGGYNLQAAFSTGYIAGLSMRNRSAR
jgi:hypothetical protein